jgi:hypothetical protein
MRWRMSTTWTRSVRRSAQRRIQLRVAKPERLDLVLVDDHVKVGQRFRVRALIDA